MLTVPAPLWQVNYISLAFTGQLCLGLCLSCRAGQLELLLQIL